MKRDIATNQRPYSMRNYFSSFSKGFQCFLNCFKIVAFNVFVSLGRGKRPDQ